MQQPAPPPGWYQDPTGPGLRWWDGLRWTEHHRAPQPFQPPGAPPPPRVPQQRWWHIPLLIALGALGTIGWIVVQLLT